MNKSILITVVLLLVIGVGYYLYSAEAPEVDDNQPINDREEDNNPQEDRSTQGERIEFETISKGVDSGGDITEPISEVVNSQEEWQAIWNDAADIDFESETVIVVYQGQKPSGGYEIDITEVTRSQNNTVTVSVTETEPGPQCGTITVITEPYHIIKLPKISPDTDVTFERSVNVVDC